MASRCTGILFTVYLQLMSCNHLPVFTVKLTGYVFNLLTVYKLKLFIKNSITECYVT